MKSILEILQEVCPDNDYENSDNFIEDELLDSLDIMELIDLLEKELNVTIEPISVLPENLFR